MSIKRAFSRRVKIMFRIIVVLIILTGIPGLLMAQSEFVDDKEGAVGISSSFTEGPLRYNLCKLDLGISINGRFDLGVSGETILNSEKNNAGFGFYLDAFALKQKNEGMPFSASIGLGTMYYDQYSTQFVAVSIMRYFSLSKVVRIQYIMAASLAMTDFEESEAVYQFSLPISMRFDNGLIIFISPHNVITEYDDYVGISLGLLMKLH
jgi:hypothetical protein